MSTAETVIQCENLLKYYRLGFFLRKRQVLHGVSFEVRRGEIFGFLGPNGAGKTTTIKVLLGLARLDGGKFSLFGHPAGSTAARRKVGFLADNPYFYDGLSALQTLHLAGRMLDLSGSQIASRSEALLEKVGLDPTAWKMPIRRYSRGMLQRLGLAQALIGEPELLICDEPMEGLDPIARREVRDLLLELRAEGKTILICTHILPDVEFMCDRIAIILKGKVERLGTLSELLTPGTKAVEVSVKGLPPPAMERIRTQAEWVREEGGGLVYTRLRTEAEAQALIKETQAAGGSVLAVTPIRERLEDYFYKLVQEGAPRA
ncbi:MAG: ABC transporter ATP-binding protein [Bdellovibrionota bacterium]